MAGEIDHGRALCLAGPAPGSGRGRHGTQKAQGRAGRGPHAPACPMGIVRRARRAGRAPASCTWPRRAYGHAALSRSPFCGAARKGPDGRSGGNFRGPVFWLAGTAVEEPGRLAVTRRIRPMRGASPWGGSGGSDSTLPRPSGPATGGSLHGAGAGRPNCAWAVHQGRRR